MATSITITNKTTSSISMDVTKTASGSSFAYIGTGTDTATIMSNTIESKSLGSGAGTASVTFNTGLSPNTQYGSFAFVVGAGDSEVSPVVDATLPCPAPTAQSLVSAGYSSAIISITTSADGGYYPKQIQYSLDNGSTWTTGTTVSSGSATTANLSITGLSPETSYTAVTRIHTAGGDTAGLSTNFTTTGAPVEHKLLCSASDVAVKATKMYCSDGTTAKRMKLYGSVNGVATRIF